MIRRMLMIVAMVLVLCAAKSTIGTDFKADALPSLDVGKTTLAQATALLGAPPQSSQVGVTGATVYTWSYIEAKASIWTGKGSAVNKRAVLVFNSDGTFQRILQLDGIVLSPADTERLISRPAIAAAPLVRAAQQGAAQVTNQSAARQYRCTDEKGQPYITVTADPPAGCVVQ